MKNARNIVDKIWGTNFKLFSPLTDEVKPEEDEIVIILPKCYDVAIVGSVCIDGHYRIAYSRDDLIRIVMMNFNTTLDVGREYVKCNHENIYNATITLFPTLQSVIKTLEVPIIIDTINPRVEV